MADEALGTGYITITIDDSVAVAQAQRAADKIAKALERGAKNGASRIDTAVAKALRRVSPGKVQLLPEIDQAKWDAVVRRQPAPELTATVLPNFDERAWNRLRTRTRLAQLEVVTVPKVSVPQWNRLIRQATAGIEIPIKVVPDTRGFDRAVREIHTPPVRVDVEPNVNAERVKKALSGIGTAALASLGPVSSLLTGLLRFGTVATVVAGAANSITGLLAALAPAAGIVAALPAVVLGFVAAVNTLKLATAGVGDAFKAGLEGDTKKFDEALKQLSPSARKVAKEVAALKPVFDDLRKTVQEGLFAPLTGQLTAVAKALAGPLKEGLTGISAEFGNAGKAVAGFLQQQKTVSQLGNVLASTQIGLTTLGPALTNVASGFLNIASAVGVAFGGQAASGIATIGQRLGDFLNKLADSGKAVTLVDNALTVFAQLGDILGNIGGIIGGVFSAANAAGAGLLQNVIRVTDSVRAFIESAKGATALQQIFSAVGAVAANLGPIISMVVSQLGGIAPLLLPVIDIVGKALPVAIGAIGGTLQAILPSIAVVASALSNAIGQISGSGVLEQIAGAFGQVLQALAPILPVAAQLVITLGRALTPIIAALAPVAGALVTAISALVEAASPLLIVVGQIIAQLGPILTPIITTVAGVFASLAPILATVGNILTTTLSPILSVLPQLIQPFLDSVNVLVSALLPPLNELLTALQPSLAEVASAFVQVITAIAPSLVQISTLAALILNNLMPLLSPLIQLIGQLAGIFAGKLASVLTDVVVPALTVVSSLLKGDFSGAFRAAEDVVKGMIKTVIDNITELPGRILDAVSNFGSLLYDAGSDLIKGMINGIKAVAGNVVQAVKDVANDAISGAKRLLGIKSPSRVFAVIGQQVGQGFANGIEKMSGTATDAARRMSRSAVLGASSLSPAIAPSTASTGPLTAAQAQQAQRSGQAAAEAVSGLPGIRAGAVDNSTTNVTFNIAEAGNADATAARVLNRLVTAGLAL